jgi:hypothetical protein
VLHGALDKVCAPEETKTMIDKTRTQKGRKIAFQVIEDADHFFEQNIEALIAAAEAYLDERLAHAEPEGPYHER